MTTSLCKPGLDADKRFVEVSGAAGLRMLLGEGRHFVPCKFDIRGVGGGEFSPRDASQMSEFCAVFLEIRCVHTRGYVCSCRSTTGSWQDGSSLDTMTKRTFVTGLLRKIWNY